MESTRVQPPPSTRATVNQPSRTERGGGGPTLTNSANVERIDQLAEQSERKFVEATTAAARDYTVRVYDAAAARARARRFSAFSDSRYMRVTPNAIRPPFSTKSLAFGSRAYATYFRNGIISNRARAIFSLLLFPEEDASRNVPRSIYTARYATILEEDGVWDRSKQMEPPLLPVATA